MKGGAKFFPICSWATILKYTKMVTWIINALKSYKVLTIVIVGDNVVFSWIITFIILIEAHSRNF